MVCELHGLLNPLERPVSSEFDSLTDCGRGLTDWKIELGSGCPFALFSVTRCFAGPCVEMHVYQQPLALWHNTIGKAQPLYHSFLLS